MSKIAVIRIRGCVRSMQQTIDTLNMLGLQRKNSMIIFEKNDSTMGMVKKVKDFVTYGEIDDALAKSIAEKRPEQNEKGFYRLNPPRGGFERKGIKTGYSIGGALGYRGADMAKLIKRML
ncbi:MAG: uL30 family ribosomal protein [Candidatus Woesearchaeota archaeon]|nr:uL30 family ribosomal protein [Candidatus Woesearchaeota archaeon]